MNSLIQNNSVIPSLDNKIEIAELNSAIRSLKQKKANGPDSIRSEMIKSSSPDLTICLQKLFNNILKIGKIPRIWSFPFLRGVLQRIYKITVAYQLLAVWGNCFHLYLAPDLINIWKITIWSQNLRLDSEKIKELLTTYWCWKLFWKKQNIIRSPYLVALWTSERHLTQFGEMVCCSNYYIISR